MSWFSFIANFLEPVSYGLCFITFLFYTCHQHEAKWRVLLAYYLLAAILMLKAAYSETNLEIYSLLCLITYICIGTYFYYTFRSQFKKRLVIILGLFHVVYYVLGNLYYSRETFDSMGFVFLSFSIVVMAFMFMHQMLNNVTEESLLLNYDFWFVSAQLIYYFGSFFIYLTYGYFTQKLLASNLYSIENRMYLSQLWLVHNVLLFLVSLITSGGIVWTHYRRKSRS